MDRVKFGTSGIRGLVTDMTDEVCYRYVTAFLKYLKIKTYITTGDAVGIGGDLRHSTPKIMNAVAAAVLDSGYLPVNCGLLPTPALALYGIEYQLATIMVTGSHIPDDRNGIKFNSPKGEILKADETGILEQLSKVNMNRFDAAKMLLNDHYLPVVDETAQRNYMLRYLNFFPQDALVGFKIGVYQHSSVARDLLPILLSSLGADVIYLGYSNKFISVDTEAIRPEDVLLARKWSQEYALDCIVSTDGDADRPLVSNELGEWLRGDILGVLVADLLQADAVVTPVSSNSVLEKCGSFKTVKRTKIGSPYVIEAMQQLKSNIVVGYEANGGFLLNTDVKLQDKILAALPTRDAILVILGVLFLAKQKLCPLSGLLASLPERFTASNRLKEFPADESKAILEKLSSDDLGANKRTFMDLFDNVLSPVVSMDYTDGVRVILENEDIVHLRASGNAPELRCYTESISEQAALVLNDLCIKYMTDWQCK